MIWFFEGSGEISQAARNVIENDDNTCFISIASIWEVAIKLSIQKLQMNISFDRLSSLIRENSFELIPVRFEHTKELITMPFHHKDPFDRLIIAQSMIEKMPVVSRDNIFKHYHVDQIW
jgi:PIN domain nuclease of toxin-antitoxin system